ncbi:TetR/AcrR family transcriptional regulator [Alloalcanivorax gelatiniphagus]|uniref:TetR/AcrR family transcriptional regulator n=1 Tax=Alloalcanivorax gelatiniphagus TaxID=1194167 RepID=A0ABY2XNA8_9GAMM|nr:TetR/AcrR family transcriptional regulator [Alloalcanivorax gelatiniphagus]TMW13924.1 TetR/AcrR family transcriptional regulator [Alloalcanivorax gelatiniphagus]|tara:strand:+ start:2657 stop:3388 length:732 start_codon:yes stop_codon:yes gene_type:complete
MPSPKVQGRRGVAPNKKTKAAARNRPGRPEGSNGQVRDRILDASELLFAERGYAGTTLREVADAAEVTQALINYYFGSKYGLFQEVFLRRGKHISDQRLERLNELEKQGPLQVVDIVRAFLIPTLELRATVSGRAFIRLQARLHTEPPEISYELRDEAYNESTKAFVEAFRKALPEISERDAHWRVILMIGAYMYAFSDTHRLEQLAPGICHPEDSEEVLQQMTAFVTAGMQATPTGRTTITP